jgi:Cu+-exporting ATPase
MALSSLSVVGNANRLRRYRRAPLPPVTGDVGTRPHVEVTADRSPSAAAAATDPVCGMQVDPATATEHRDTADGTVYFCSPHCAATFDADTNRHPTRAAGAQ